MDKLRSNILKRSYVVLFSIILLAAFLRLFQLSIVPPSPDWDEVAYGYNAYSILKTGADEYGVKLPVILRSYDDYKPALYSYAAIPSVAIFGLNTFAVRLPDALFSILGVLAVFYLVRTVFKRDGFALLSSFFLAVSPWHIQFSRFSHEAVISVAFNILFVLFFLLGLKKYKFLILSSLFWALSFYSYQSEKLFSPLLGLLIFAIFIKEIIKLPKKYILGCLLTIALVILPMFSYILHDSKALSRAVGTSIFSHQTEILNQSANQLIQDKRDGNLAGIIVHNRRVIYAETFAQNYLVHFDPSWLFLKGDLARHHPPGMGILYLWDLPFILLGILYLLKTKSISRKYKLLIFGWFLLAPIPAAFTYDVPHAARDMNELPIYQIFTALGVFWLALSLKKRVGGNLFKLSLTAISLLFIINFAYYLNQYFGKLDYLYSSQWQYGYSQAISTIQRIEGNYQRVIISNRVPMDQSYMFFLFYLKYPPRQYQLEGSNKSFDKFVFKNIDWKTDYNSPSTLIVGSSRDIPKSANPIETINFLNGQPAIIIAGSKK